jgi:hypothetical protein
VDQVADLGPYAIIGVDTSSLGIDWERIPLNGTLFLGCTFRDDAEEILVRRRGAHVLSAFAGLPYDPYRGELYTPEEQMRGHTPGRATSADEEIYLHYLRNGEAEGRRPHIKEAIAQRIHDFSIDRALRRFLEVNTSGKPEYGAVGIMGSHRVRRDMPEYEKIARLARLLARRGYLVATGGGSGLMEAGNLGAYLAPFPDEALPRAIGILQRATDPGDMDPDIPPVQTTDRRIRRAEYLARAREVVERFPRGRAAHNLSVPTWHYGNEPINLFATHVAKYFSNGIREDRLLMISTNGVVFGQGGADTRQEIFQVAAQNHHCPNHPARPMLFLGTPDSGPSLFSVVQAFADNNYRDLLFASDDPEELACFLEDPGHQPRLPRPGSQDQP